MNPTDGRQIEVDPLDERLVAYLDGELDDDARHQVERQLAEDATWRDRLHELQHAWDLLDDLPHLQTDRSFTQTTVEMVAAKAVQDTEAARMRLVRRLASSWLGWGVGVAVAVLAGYLFATAIITVSRNRLVADLPVIDQVDQYGHADSIEFLRKLDAEGLFPVDDVAAGESVVTHTLFPESDLFSVARRVEALTASEKKQLQRKQERFDRLTPDNQNHLRRLHAAVVADEQSERLQGVMAQYQEWLKTLPTGQRAVLLELPADQRVAEIKKLSREQAVERFSSFLTTPVGREDTERIFEWFDNYVKKHEREILRSLPDDERSHQLRARFQEPMDQRQRAGMLMFVMRRRGFDQTLPEPDDAEMARLIEQLSPEVAAALKSLGGGPREQAETVLRAAMESRRWSPPEVNPQELWRRFAELSPEERERLENMPRDEFLRELQRPQGRRDWSGGRPPRRGSFGRPSGGPRRGRTPGDRRSGKFPDGEGPPDSDSGWRGPPEPDQGPRSE